MTVMLAVSVGVASSCAAISISLGHSQLAYEGVLLGLVVGAVAEIAMRVLRRRALPIQELGALMLCGLSLVTMKGSEFMAKNSGGSDFSCRMYMVSMAALCGTCFSVAAYMNVSRVRH